MAVKLEKLIKMAEQISDNMRFSDNIDQVADKIADHINRFWDPRMRATLVAISQSEQETLSKELKKAITRVNDQ